MGIFDRAKDLLSPDTDAERRSGPPPARIPKSPTIRPTHDPTDPDESRRADTCSTSRTAVCDHLCRDGGQVCKGGGQAPATGGADRSSPAPRCSRRT